MTAPRIACIMPFLNEARHLPDVLASLTVQTLPRERFFIIGVDNGSYDGSDALFIQWLSDHRIAGELVREAVRSIPRALNAGLAHAARDDLIVRLDAHTLYQPDYLATIDAAFAALPADVWCVGGAPTPHPQPRDYGTALVSALYSNPLGLGPADFRRDVAAAREVTTVYLGAYRAGVLTRLGGFDERWVANEDAELTERIRAGGGRIFRVPVRMDLIVTRGPVAMVRQWNRYGFWRMQTFRRYPTAVRLRHVVPPAALLIALGLALSRARAWLVPLYLAYALATVLARRRGEPAMVTAGTLLFFPLVHVGYACGLFAGLLRRPRNFEAPRAVVANNVRAAGYRGRRTPGETS